MAALMAIPTTALQVSMMLADWCRHRDDMVEIMQRLYYPALFDLLRKRIFLQRPRTDDMMQMCVDLGINVPDRQPISYDGLTFRLEKSHV